MFAVGDQGVDLALSGLAGGFVILLLVSLWPWRIRGGRHRWTLALPVAALAGYAVYESLMPDRFDIRVDLLIVAPIVLAIVLIGAGRALFMLRTRRRP